MKIGFLVKKIYNFQYFVPLHEFLSSNSNIEIKLFIDKRITIDRNFAKIRQFFKKQELYYSEDVMSADLDILFSIDSDDIITDDFSARKFRHIIIQNYHDYSLSMQREDTSTFYKNSDTFWCIDDYFMNIAKVLNYRGEFLCCLTPNYWYFKNNKISKQYFSLSNKKKAVCFLPRNKEIELDYVKNLKYTPEEDTFTAGEQEKFFEHAIEFSKLLEENDFEVVFKQRSLYSTREKFNNFNYIETNNIYPNESLELAHVSDFGYGYMTSACMHYDVFKKNYINFMNNNYPAILKSMFKTNIKPSTIQHCNITDSVAIPKLSDSTYNIIDDIDISQNIITKYLNV